MHGPSARGLIAIGGSDAVSFLQGILTNDIQHLEAGAACYSAYLTPQGRMLADMNVLRREDEVLLDVEPGVREELVRRLDQSLFAEDVRIADRSGDFRAIAICGPAAAAALTSALKRLLPAPPASPATDRHVTMRIDGAELIVLGTDRTGAGGFHLLGAPLLVASLVDSLLAAGVEPLGSQAAESLRIEAGIPRFGDDMTEDTIPLEAGIEGRAISMTKGCYVGQEVIVRILHRGHGRVAKRLVGLRAGTDAAPPPGTRLQFDGREVGSVTSSVVSPRLGPIALGYVHRDFTEPGTRLAMAGGADGPVTVTSLPFGEA